MSFTFDCLYLKKNCVYHKGTLPQATFPISMDKGIFTVEKGPILFHQHVLLELYYIIQVANCSLFRQSLYFNAFLL